LRPLHIRIAGKPIAKKRPKFARRGKFVTAYNEQETEEGKVILFIRDVVRMRSDFQVMTGPVKLKATFFLPRPKSHYGTGRNSGLLKESAPFHHTSKPDLDNLLKFYKDCCNEIVWRDDSQVNSIFAEKMYSDTEPSTYLEIEEV